MVGQGIIFNALFYMVEFGAGTFEKFFPGRQITEQVLDFHGSALAAAGFMDFMYFAVANFHLCTQGFIFRSGDEDHPGNRSYTWNSFAPESQGTDRRELVFVIPAGG